MQKVKEAIAGKGLGKEALEVAEILYDQRFRDQILTDAISCLEHFHPTYDSVSTLGFCLGGGLSLNVAVNSNHTCSAISFYGEPPKKKEDVAKTSSPLLVIYAAEDEIINAKVPAFVESALDSGKDLTLRIYPSTRHGFFNNTKGSLYKEAAAKDAWELTKQFLRRTTRQ